LGNIRFDTFKGKIGGFMHSKKIYLKTTSNTRDLGVIVNKDGLKIKEKKLYRSDELTYLAYDDAKTLYEDYNLRVIVDLRNHREMVQRKDVIILDQKYVENTLLLEGAIGISYDEETLKKKEELWRKANRIPQYAKLGMENFYREMVDEHGSKMLGRFLKEVLNNDDATLWHCAVGKDRCGVATAVLLKALDVDDKTIMTDYLYTNHCYSPGYVPKDTVRDWCDYAHRDYLEVVIEEIDKRFDSFDDFLINGCNFSVEERKKLKEKYLEKQV
jgi:protein-tyrosine phosphatase